MNSLLSRLHVYRQRDLLQILFLAVLYALLDHVSLKISSSQGMGNLIRLPSGIAITALLVYGLRLWPGLFLGALLGAQLAGAPLSTSVFSAIGNTLDPLLASWLLVHQVKNFDVKLAHPRDLWLLICFGGLLGPLLNAAIGTPAYLINTPLSLPEVEQCFISWWMSAFIGVVMLAPLLIMLITRPIEVAMILMRPGETCLLLLSTLGLLWGQSQHWNNLIDSHVGAFLFIPILVWAAARMGQRGTSLIALLIYSGFLVMTYWDAQALSGFVENGWNLWLLGVVMTLCSQFVAVMFNERTQMLDALLESEQRHRLSLMYGGIGAWEADLISNQQIWSESCSQLLGFPAIDNPTWKQFLSAIHPQDRTAVIDAMNAHIEHGALYDVQYRIIRSDGQIRWMRSVGQIERDDNGKPARMRGIVQDINDYVLLNQSLKESQNRYRALLQDASDAILIANTNGMLEEINSAGELLLGYNRDEICRMTWTQIHPLTEEDNIRQHFKDIVSNRSTGPIATKILRKDGGVVDVEIRPALVEIGGRIVVQGVIIDLTERTRIEKERLVHERAHRETLVREVHHRIKNNLQGITGILRQFADKHPETEALLNQVVSQVQSVAVIHGLQGKESFAKVRACELTTAIASGVESLWQRPVTVDIPERWIPCAITETEAVPLALILNELISNAVKHGGPDDQVRITLRHEPRQDTIKLVIYNAGLIPEGFGFADKARLGTGLQLVQTLLPVSGASVSWSQLGNTVVTTVDLEFPIIHLETISLNIDEH